jgi:hypothetical protein
MGYKAPAIHGNCYSTDCDCKYHTFSEFRVAKIHCIKCAKATRVIYHSPYAPDRITFEKGRDASS